MKLHLNIFLLSFIICSFHRAHAHTVYDVMNNQQYEVNNQFKEVNSTHEYIKQKIELTCMQLKGDRYKSINSKLMDISSGVLTNEQDYLIVFNSLKQRLDVYTELENSKNKYRYDRYTKPDAAVLSLSDIDFDALSVVNNVMYAQLKFKFQLNDEQRYSRNENSILISQFYTINLTSGVISRLVNNLTNAQIERIQTSISAALNETYSIATSKLNLSELNMLNDEEENSYEQHSNERYRTNLNDSTIRNKLVCKDICQRINLKEADIYWYAWGIMIEFQEFTVSSKIYNGQAFQLFIPFDKSALICNTIADFAFLRTMKMPQNQQTSFNYYTIQERIDGLKYSPEIEDVLHRNPMTDVPRSLKLESYQLFENGKKNFRGTFTCEFSGKQQILSKTFIDENKRPVLTQLFEYNTSGNLIASTKKESSRSEENDTYVYDSKQNLLEHKLISRDRLAYHTFFYNGNYIYSFDQTFLKPTAQDDIKIMMFDKRQLCYNDLCYALNEQGKVKGTSSSKYIMYSIQYARDQKGRLIEAHVENERYNYYYYYDSLNRLTKFEVYEFQKQIKQIDYLYEGISTLPFKQSKVSYQSGQKIMEEELYVWELFK